MNDMNLIRVIGTLSFLITHVKTLLRNFFVTEQRNIDCYPTNHEISGLGKMWTNTTLFNACHYVRLPSLSLG